MDSAQTRELAEKTFEEIRKMPAQIAIEVIEKSIILAAKGKTGVFKLDYEKFSALRDNLTYEYNNLSAPCFLSSKEIEPSEMRILAIVSATIGMLNRHGALSKDIKVDLGRLTVESVEDTTG